MRLIRLMRADKFFIPVSVKVNERLIAVEISTVKFFMHIFLFLSIGPECGLWCEFQTDRI